MLLTEVSNGLDFMPLEDFAQWIIGVIENNGLGLIIEKCGQFLNVQSPISGCHCFPWIFGPRCQGNEFWNAPGQPNHGLVAIEIWLNDNDFIARIDVTHDGTKEGLISAVGDQNFCLSINWSCSTIQEMSIQGSYKASKILVLVMQ